MIILEEKHINEYIIDTFNDIKLKSTKINEDFHHNCDYKQAPSICKYGILSLNELNKIGITNYSKEELEKFGDIESHINGNDSVSLSKVGLTDLYKNEDIYNPYNANLVDFIVSKEVKARRSTLHYGNEYLVDNKIGIEYLVSLDIRLLELIKNSKNNKEKIKSIIEKFNYLKDIATNIKETNLGIPIRETSSDTISLDIEKLATIKKIKIK